MKFIQIRKEMGLIRTCQQGCTPESIRGAMVELRAIYPNAGAREMISLLHHERNMSVSRSVIREYFATYEPHLVRQRKARHLQRCWFWAAGVNDLWAVDQHDKWNRFGLALHTGVEPFSRKILWIRIWHSNRNLQLILTYYLDVVEELGFIPLITQSDPGSENFGIANAQTMLHQWHDPALEGTLQHRFKSLLDEGVNQGWYDVDNTLQLSVTQYDLLMDLHTILLHGVPELVFSSPQDYGALDLKFMVNKATLKHVRQLYINTGHPVFDLVPRPLHEVLEECYNDLGHPAVTRLTIWHVYLDLLHAMQDHATLHLDLPTSPADADANDDLPLLEGQHDLPFNDNNDGYYYMGSVGGGLGLDETHVHQLNELENIEEEHYIIEGGPDVVVSQFSDEELVGNEDDWS
ncbi:hypothetical protein EDD16DRAFT_1730184 [Pisolithus croceorrhizus]|nr:hypothetical protein EDD16DRAFT_1730184 [Pisolithus croceorrhizus]